MPRKPKNKLPEINFSHEETGKRIASFRKLQGLTQKELAEKIGVSRTVITDYENCRIRIYDEMLVRLSKALNVSIDEILGINNNNLKDKAPSLRIIKRVQRIENLPPSQQKAILKTLDLALSSVTGKIE